MTTDPDLEQKILELYNQGNSLRMIQDMLNISRESARLILEANNYVPKWLKKNRWGRMSYTVEPIREYEENGIKIKVYAAGFAWGYEVKRTVK